MKESVAVHFPPPSIELRAAPAPLTRTLFGVSRSRSGDAAAAGGSGGVRPVVTTLHIVHCISEIYLTY